MTEVGNEDVTLTIDGRKAVSAALIMNSAMDLLQNLEQTLAVAMLIKARHGERSGEFIELVSQLLPQVGLPQQENQDV